MAFTTNPHVNKREENQSFGPGLMAERRLKPSPALEAKLPTAHCTAPQKQGLWNHTNLCPNNSSFT